MRQYPWIVSGALLVGACNSSAASPVGPAACVLRSDCTAPLACVLGFCHQECVETSDCPPKAHCRQLSAKGYNGCAADEESRCSYNSDCKDALTCSVDGKCRAPCKADKDCSLKSQTCDTVRDIGVCVDPTELTITGHVVDDGKGGPAGAGGGSAGGSSGSAGSGGTTSAGGTVGGAGTSGGGGTGGSPPTCATRSGISTEALVYSGPATGTSCGNTIDPPGAGVWRPTGDGTSTVMAIGTLGGRTAAPDCAMHNSGDGFSDWGAGMAFGLNMAGAEFCRYDASAFQGVRMYLKGSAVGSAGSAAGGLNANTVRVGVATVQTASVDEGGTCVEGMPARCNDHFAKFCTFGADWTLCDLPLSSSALTQLGFGAVLTFDKSQVTEIVFEIHRATSAATVSFDLWVDDITFY